MISFPFRRVWIIGARGVLGSALESLFLQCRVAYEWRGDRAVPRKQPNRTAEELAAAAEHTLAIDPRCSGGQGCAAYVQEPGNIERLLAASGAPEVVYFCAATRGGDAAAYRRAYLEPVQAVAAAVPGARLVFCSSTAVYEGQGEVTEDTPTPGSTEKLRILLAAEQAALAAGGVVARLAPLYGGAQGSLGRCELLRRHLAGEPQLPGAPQRMLNYLGVSAAAEALLLLGTAPQLRHRVYNVCSESFTKAQAYAMLEALTGVPASREVSPAGRRGVSDHRVVAERIRELGGEPPQRFADYVQRVVPR